MDKDKKLLFETLESHINQAIGIFCDIPGFDVPDFPIKSKSDLQDIYIDLICIKCGLKELKESQQSKS